METNIPTTGRAGGRNAGWITLCIAAGALAVVILPAYLLLPALWTAAMYRTRPQLLAPFAAVTFGARWLLSADWLSSLCFMALAALPALALYIMQKRRMNMVYTAAAMAALSLIALYGMVCMPGVISGEGAFTAVETMFSEACAYSRAVAAATPGVPETLIETYSQYLELLEDVVPTLIVPVLCGTSCTLALSNLLFFRLFARKRAWGLARLRPFYEWSIPKSMTTGLVLFLIASIVVSCAGWEYAAGLSGTINVIVGFPLIVQGLATLDFCIRRWKKGTDTVRTLIYVGVALLFAVLQSALMMIGCFEQVFHLRERMRTPRMQRPMM